jgi:hypothetical protein
MARTQLPSTVIVLLAAVLAGAPASAQDSALPEPGSRLRITAPAVAPKPIVGTLAEARERDLVLADSSSDRTTIPLASITRLERSVRPSRRTTGALAGFIVGLAAVGLTTLHDGGCNDGCNGGDVATAGLVALSTAAVGAVVSPGERWADVPVGGEQGPSTVAPHAALRVRLVPQVGRRTGLILIASF